MIRGLTMGWDLTESAWLGIASVTVTAGGLGSDAGLQDLDSLQSFLETDRDRSLLHDHIKGTSPRDPERSDCFWVNRNGDVVEGDRPVNGAAFAIHSQIHAARPDVEAAGTPIHIDHDTAVRTQQEIGRPASGWFSFQPLYENMVRQHPDLLD